MEVYVLKDKKTIFYYNYFCNHMNNSEAIKKSNNPLMISFGDLENFICELQKRIDFNRKFGWRKRVSFN